MRNTLFLGKGFVSQVAHSQGASLLSRQESHDSQIYLWDPMTHLSDVLLFESYLVSQLGDKLTDIEGVILTFPAIHLSQNQMGVLAGFCQKHSIRCVLLGSWSSIQGETQVGPQVFQLIDTQERNLAERDLLNLLGDHGLRILLAGIWGVGRSPIDWLKRGLISNSKPSVNLIHPEDICDFIALSLQRNLRGSIALCDGKEVLWGELEAYLKGRSMIELGFQRPDLRSKRPTRYIIGEEFEDYYSALAWKPRRKYSPELDLELNPNLHF